MASISVGCEEVPLTLYFHVVDLWVAGYSTINIINTLVDFQSETQSPLSADTIANIIHNQEIIQAENESRTTHLTVLPCSSRRLSRIANVSELDDLSVAHMVAQKKEKEKLGLRQMLAKLSA